ncbi:RNA polymerase sigma factor [Candidatus Sumerlaeota bacterium]|nr:RNA polymerase sigma factor [Candidatus Sumerlaeota bacterium]
MDSQEAIRDEILVLRCQEGDAAAFESLLERWQDRLWRHACRITGDDDAAWDAIQDTWIDISRCIRRLRTPSAFKAWAYRITTNKRRDLIRKEKRRREVVEDFFEGAVVRETPELNQANDPLPESLADAMKRLPGKDRTILSLKYEEDFEISEIAAILDIPEGTVKSRLYLARIHLKNIMERRKNGRS